jgi:hypothetical protein
MISNSVLRIIVSSNFLTSVHPTNLRLSSLGLGFNSLLILNLKESFLEDFSGPFSVLVLTAFLLNKDT